MSYTPRTLFVILLVIALSTLSPPYSEAEDSLKLAADRYREKDYGAAYLLAGRSANQQYRSFVAGMAAFRLEKYEEAVTMLADAEARLPLLADYALLYQGEALFRLNRFFAASAKMAALRTSFPGSILLRRSDKLSADILHGAADFQGAVKGYRAFIEKYPSGNDAIDANYHLAISLEQLGDAGGAAAVYRSIWLNNPAAPQSGKAYERIKQLGSSPPQFTQEDLLKRAATLYELGEYSDSLKTVEMIPALQLQPALSARIDLRAGMALFRLRQYRLAEGRLAKAAASPQHEIATTARFWLAKSIDRQGDRDRSLSQFLELAKGERSGSLAVNAMTEAALIKRGQGQYVEAALQFEQAARQSTAASAIRRYNWEAAWCRYLAGEYSAASAGFSLLMGDEQYREKALYWKGRALEKSGSADAASHFKTVLDDYPAGFYAAWHREERGYRDTRVSAGREGRVQELPLPAGFERPHLLGRLGLIEEARQETAQLRRKSGDSKGLFPPLLRHFVEMHDYGSAIALFMQNRPIPWEHGTMALWNAGYPLAYSDLIARYAAQNSLSEGVVYALIRAESAFTPAIKSGAGAVGLMQLMPATARQVSGEKGAFNPQRLINPEYNVRLGTKHLKDLLNSYKGDLVYSAAAYNAGAAALERWLKGSGALAKDEFIENIPYQETREYVKKVYASAAIYRQLYGLK